MGRKAEGWKLVWRDGVASVRFTHDGKRYFVSTRQRETESAMRRAGEIFAEITCGLHVTERGSLDMDVRAVDRIADALFGVGFSAGDRLVSAKEASEVLAIDVSAVMRSRLPRITLGRCVRFSSRDIESMKAGQDIYLRPAGRWARSAGASAPTGRVYFACASAARVVKIGWSSHDDVRRRLASLQTGCPFALNLHATVTATQAAESNAHHLFAHARLDGGTEWFRITAPMIEFLDDLQQLAGLALNGGICEDIV